MPWRSYAVLTDEDAYAVAAYLKTLTPVIWREEPAMAGEGETPPGPYLTVAMP
jgi:cytochrome c